MANPDYESISWLRIFIASFVVFGLIALLGLTLKYVRLRGLSMPGARTRRLQLVESLPIDVRRRLVIVRCDEAEHLLLLGQNQDTVVETNLDSSQTALATKTTPPTAPWRTGS